MSCFIIIFLLFAFCRKKINLLTKLTYYYVGAMFVKSTRVAVSTFIETLSNMSALFSLNFFPGFRLRRKDGKLQGVHLFATLLPNILLILVQELIM